MNMWQVIVMVSFMGGVGGLVNCLISGELVLPQRVPNTQIWRPGWIGNIVVGAVAAFVVYSSNGGFGPVTSATVDSVKLIPPTLAQLGTCIVTGLGGGTILTQMAHRQAESAAKDNLAATLTKLI